MTVLDYTVFVLAGMAAVVTIGGMIIMKLSHEHKVKQEFRTYR